MVEEMEEGGADSLMPDKRDDRIRELEAQVEQLEAENRRLRSGEEALEMTRPMRLVEPVEELSKEHVERYSRQLLLSEGFGVEGQRKLLSSSILVVGAGGIGSTALLYLAAAGVGRIDVVDFDGVEISNLHRQVIHNSSNVGLNKAVSACRAIRDLNPTIQCNPITTALDHDNALGIVQQHDCIIDCSDNPKTRYLINDACVLAGTPLISGSAIGMEGQLTVYNWKESSCYRCLYPAAAVAAGCRACTDSGVLGTVPGLIGILQATEALKVLTGMGEAMHDRLLMYDAARCSFMSLKKPPKRANCPVCGPEPTIRSMEDSRESLLTAQGPKRSIVAPPLPDELNVSCSEYNRVRNEEIPHILLDVRVKQQFDMCSLDGADNVPLARLVQELDRIEELSDSQKPIYCICRRGIASVEATNILQSAKATRPRIHSVRNVAGGLTAWREQVDESFPKY